MNSNYQKNTRLFNILYIVIKINRFQYFYTKKFSLSFEKKIRNRKNFEQKKSKIFDQIKKLFKKKRHIVMN